MKIIFFVGREHHALKLANLRSLLQERGNEVVNLIANNAINIDPASEFIWGHGPHKHIYEYLYNGLGRDVAARVDELMAIALDEKLSTYVPPFWSAYSIWEATEFLLLVERMLDKENPDAVVVLHANNFWTRILLYAAQKIGIWTYATQEGLLRHRDQKTQGKQSSAAQYVDRLFTWSPADKQAYTNAGIEEKVVTPVGPMHLDALIGIDIAPYREGFRASLGLEPNKPLVVFAPPAHTHFQGNMQETTLGLASYCLNMGVSLAIRLHPFDSAHDAVRELVKVYPNVVLPDESPEMLMKMADLVITQHSTIAVEAAFLGTPVGIIDLDSAGILESPVKDGYGIEISRIEDIGRALNGEIKPFDLDGWRSVNATFADGEATKRAAEVIESDVI